MANRATVQTTYEATRIIRPIYTGGSVSLSADGRVLATTLGEDALLTDPVTGDELARIEGDGEPITTLALTPSASHLIICSRSFSMRIYSLQPTITSSKSFKTQLDRTLKPHTAPVVTSAVDRTGTLLATGGSDGTVKVWDIRGGYNTHSLHGHGGIVSALHFFEVDPSAAEIEQDSKLRKKRQKKKGQEDVETEGTLGYRLASGGEDGKIRIWNLHKRVSIVTLDSHVSVVRSLDFSAEENALLSASRDKTVTVWDARTWKTRSIIPVLESVESAGFLNRGSLFFTGGEDGRIRIRTTTGGREITQPQTPGNETDAILDVIHHDTLPYLLSIQADQTFVLHSLAPLAETSLDDQIPPLPIIRRISGTHDEVIDLAFVGQDRSRLALATNLEDIRIISLADVQSGAELADSYGGNAFGSDIALLKGHDEIIICIDIDRSGHWLATGAKDNSARLWRLDPSTDSYTCWATFTGHAESLGAIALPHSAPSKGSAAYDDPLNHPPEFLVTGSEDKTIKKWEIPASEGNTGRAAYTRAAHEKDINALDLSSNSQVLASASQDRTVKIWDASTGDQIGTLRGHRRGVWTVKFAPPNTTISGASAGATSKGLIATGSGDKTVKIWSLADYTCLQTFEGHANSVLKIVWLSPQVVSTHDKRGSQLASAAGDGLVKVWDLSSGEIEATLDNHTDRVWALTVDPTTNNLISGGADSVVTFWTDTTRASVTKAAIRETERVEQEQQLQNYIHGSNYREAIALALQLDQPMRLYSLFQTVVEAETQETGSLSGSKAVDEVIADLADEQIFKLLMRLRDWNTNARTAQVAQRILSVVVRSYSADRLAGLRVNGKSRAKTELQVREVLDALKAWTERHYRRVEEMVDESYLVEFTLGQMDDILGIEQNPYSVLGLGNGDATSGAANPYAALGLGRGVEEIDDDMVMVD